MATESLSQVSAPAESEERATVQLALTTLAGEECLDSFLEISSFAVDCNLVYLSGLEVEVCTAL